MPNSQKGFMRILIIIVIGVVLLFSFRIVSEHFLGINPIKFEGAKKQDDSSNNPIANVFQRESGEGQVLRGNMGFILD